MIVRGRVSLFGEYLMHEHSPGCVLPTRLVLASGNESSYPLHADYLPTKDSIRSRLLKECLRTEETIRGDLPFGYGFASSTALGFLHLGRYADRRGCELLFEADKDIQGFVPSGVDLAYCKRQTSGLFFRGSWCDVAVCPLPCLAILLPKESRLSLVEVRSRVLRTAEALAAIAKALAESVRRFGWVEHHQLMEYCSLLMACDAYSRLASEVVNSFLERGFAAKAIGGLYDKAIIVFHAVGGATAAQQLADEVDRAIAGATILRDIEI